MLILTLNYMSTERKLKNELFEQFNHVFSGKSFDQSIILMKTLRFITQDVNEYDPDLIEFVKSLIIKPSEKELNLEKPNQLDYSQQNQSIYMNELLNNKRNGFFIESGAHDGEYLSNSLYFEKNLDWTGLLIEPIKNSFDKLITKNRNVYAINACISKNKPFLAKFKSATVFSGREEYLTQTQKDHIKKYYDEKSDYVPCFSLNTILRALEIKNVDMFSLDIEGMEWDVIESIDFSKFNIGLFCIEWFYLKDKKQKIHDHLLKNGYKFVTELEFDYFFQKNIY
jgi:FkbM family methyltransferase